MAADLFDGCAKMDGVVGLAGAVNEYNPDTKSKVLIKAYGVVRKDVRAAQEAKKFNADTLQVCE